MGIFSEIGLYKPADGAYRPGDVVSGIIKYGVDKDTQFTDITISLKGLGTVFITENVTRYNGKRQYVEQITYKNSELYVDIDYVIKNGKDEVQPILCNKGMYEAQFNFRLPVDIPTTLNFVRHRGNDQIKCFILYYVRIKFKTPNFMKFAKRFRKELTVVSSIRPTLPTEPTICGEKKILAQIFSCKKRVIDVKATIENSVIPVGGRIKFDCEVSNLTDITVKAICPKLIELYTFVKPKGFGETYHEEKVKNTSSKTGAIKSGKWQNFEFEINVPSDKMSLENSKIVSRKYAVVIEVLLPIPHRNAVLKIPVQIGDIIGVDEQIGEVSEYHLDAPPTYWDSMAEQEENDEAIFEKK